MRIGIDTFTIRDLKLDPYQTIDYLKNLGFEGVLYGGIRSISENLDTGNLRDIRDYADSRDMYSYVSVSVVNPVIYKDGFDKLKERITEEIKAAAAGNWHELHSIINVEMERYCHSVPWSMHINQCIKLINSLRPVLEKYGSRINIETHGETTFDVLKVIEATGEHLTGVCLDTANMLANAEDPVLAAKRVAPYTYLTHAKDGIVYFSENGISRQGKPPGQGNVDWEMVLSILGKYNPDLPLSIEDHKWLSEARVFNKDWIEKNPELTPYELGQFVKLAWKTQQKINLGEITAVDIYEATPYLDEMEGRIVSGQKYLRELLKKLNLYQ